MDVKQALLRIEIDRVKTFLTSFDLGFDERVTETLYVEADGKIVGTVSRLDHLIECLAVDPSYQGENLSGLLVGTLLGRMRECGIFHYLVFTKTVYAPVFESLNFRRLAATPVVCILEGGSDSLSDALGDLKHRIRSKWPGNDPADTAAIVVNCNPITLGHFGLIETAASRHERLLVFVVEEDLSLFSYTERFSLVYLALAPLENVLVLPSTKYVVSNLTFPSYFLKTMDEREEEHARLDAILFRDYFMKELDISKRYLGTESDPFMIKYNAILQNALGPQVEIIQRFEKDGVTISASIVRRLILENRIEEALDFVPPATRGLLKKLAEDKYARSRR
jgi:[citrate (pro-3S)-lyase] ligase